MARTTKPKAVDAVDLELEEGTLEAPDADEAVEVLAAVAAPEAAKPDKQARFILNQDHTCRIGGKDYEFLKDREEKAPVEVKDILKDAGLIAIELR